VFVRLSRQPPDGCGPVIYTLLMRVWVRAIVESARTNNNLEAVIILLIKVTAN
jgi:hypothetical protein